MILCEYKVLHQATSISNALMDSNGCDKMILCEYKVLHQATSISNALMDSWDPTDKQFRLRVSECVQ